MKNIHEPSTLQELIKRFDTLKPDSPRQWGKMDVAQMLAHLSNALEVNLGDKVYKHGFMGKIFGRIAKKSVTSDKPFKPGLPTDPNFVIAGNKDFNAEKQRTITLVKRLSAASPTALAANVHPFFGRMSADEWNRLNYKHLDHHLRQFGA